MVNACRQIEEVHRKPDDIPLRAALLRRPAGLLKSRRPEGIERLSMAELERDLEELKIDEEGKHTAKVTQRWAANMSESVAKQRDEIDNHIAAKEPGWSTSNLLVLPMAWWHRLTSLLPMAWWHRLQPVGGLQGALRRTSSAYHRLGDLAYRSGGVGPTPELVGDLAGGTRVTGWSARPRSVGLPCEAAPLPAR